MSDEAERIRRAQEEFEAWAAQRRGESYIAKVEAERRAGVYAEIGRNIEALDPPFKYPPRVRVDQPVGEIGGGPDPERRIVPDVNDPARDAPPVGGSPWSAELARPAAPEGGDGKIGMGSGGPLEEGGPPPAQLPPPPPPPPAGSKRPQIASFGFEAPRNYANAQRFAGAMPVEAGPEARLFEIAGAVFDETLFVENSLAFAAARAETAKRMVRQVYEATGVELADPTLEIDASVADRVGRLLTLQGPDPEARQPGAALADFDRQIAELRARYPDKAAKLPQKTLGELTLDYQREIYARAEDVRARSVGGLEGFAGELAGGMGGSFGDPVQLAALPVGFGARTILGAVVTESAVNAGLVGGLEFIRDKEAWRDVTGREYTMDDFFSRVGTAAAFGGVIGGGGKFLQQGAGRVFGDRESFEVFRKKYDALPPDHPFRIDETFQRAVISAQRSFDDGVVPDGLTPEQHSEKLAEAKLRAAAPEAFEATDPPPPPPIDGSAPAGAGGTLFDADAHPAIVRAAEDPTDANLDAAAEAIETGVAQGGRAKQPREPARLRTFLRAMGGMTDRDGNLRNFIDYGQGRPDRLINNRGVDPDNARVAAWEAGFFYGAEPPELDEFLQVLADDFSEVSPRYRLDDLRAVDEWNEFVEARRAGEKAAQIPFPDDEVAFSMRAFHGTPHDFDAFSLAHMGSGEGAQARGWGLYLAESATVAGAYRSKLAGNDLFIDGKPFDRNNPRHIASQMVRQRAWSTDAVTDAINALEYSLKTTRYSHKATRAAERKVLKEAIRLLKAGEMPGQRVTPPKGFLYEVEFDARPEELLDLDVAIEKQAAGPRAGIAALEQRFGMAARDGELPEEFFARIERQRGPEAPREISETLREAGVPGSRFLDQKSRARGDGTRNLVIFDDSRLTVAGKRGPQGAAAIPRPDRAGIEAEAVKAFGELPPGVKIGPAPEGVPDGAVAMTDKRTGEVTLFEGRIAQGEVGGVILHEIGAHAGIQAMIPAKDWADLLDFVMMRAEKNEGAWAGVLDAIPFDTPPHLRVEEALGYFLEKNAGNPELVARERWWQRLLQAVRDWAAKALPWLKRELTDRDVMDLARGAVQRRIDDGVAAADGRPLPMDEASRNARAEAMGFTIDAFHGTAEDITEFGSPPPFRAGMRDDNAIFFTAEPDIANSYAMNKGRRGTPGEAMPDLFERNPDKFREGANVMPVKIRLRDPLTVDAKGQHWSRAWPAAMLAAQRGGHDGVIMKNVDDWGDAKMGREARSTADKLRGRARAPRTVYAVFDPADVRSRFAAFDPAEDGSANILFSQGSPTGRAQPAPAGSAAANPRQPSPGNPNPAAGPPTPQLARQRWLDALKKQAERRVGRALVEFRNGSGNRDAGEFLQAIFDYHGQGNLPAEMSMDPLRRGIIAETLSEMDAALNHFRSGTGGRRLNKADLDNFVKEMFGEDTKDAAAKAMAQAVQASLEKLRVRFNAAGGQIGKLERWGLPQHHNRLALDKWIERQDKKLGTGRGHAALKQRLFDSLDISRMRDVHTGKPMTSQAVWDALDDVIEDMRTDGWATRTPSRQAVGGGSIASRRAEHRFLIFRDAETWMAWQRDFGAGDPVMGIVAHVEGMARDIAAMEVLGPNPESMITWLQGKAQAEAAARKMGRPAALPDRFKGRAAEKYVKAKIGRMNSMWENYTGEINVPDNEWLAKAGANVRNVITSSTLGGAILSAVPTDPVFQAMARHFAGASHGKALKMMATAFKDPKRARQLQLIMDHTLSAFGTDARQAGFFGGTGWSAVLANQTIAMQGLSVWTRWGRTAFGMGMLADLGEAAGTKWDDLAKPLQRFLARYGFSEGDWDAIRASQLTPEGFLDPAQIRVTAGRRLMDRLKSAIMSETEYAVPSGTLRTRSLINFGTRPGTFMGEIARSGRMFTSFAATIPMLYGYRIAHLLNSGGKVKGAMYAASMIAGLTLGGAVAMQMKALASGKDAQDMNDGEFWKAAFLQGGGLGIYGDFLFGDLNRMDRGLEQTLAGPAVTMAGDLIELTFGNLNQALSGEDSKAGREWVDFLTRNVPGSNIWYLRNAYDRWIEDGLRFAVDPKAEESFRRKVKDLKRNTGQGYFWAPGTAAPQRGPVVSEAPPPQPAAN